MIKVQGEEVKDEALTIQEVAVRDMVNQSNNAISSAYTELNKFVNRSLKNCVINLVKACRYSEGAGVILLKPLKDPNKYYLESSRLVALANDLGKIYEQCLKYADELKQIVEEEPVVEAQEAETSTPIPLKETTKIVAKTASRTARPKVKAQVVQTLGGSKSGNTAEAVKRVKKSLTKIRADKEVS